MPFLFLTAQFDRLYAGLTRMRVRAIGGQLGRHLRVRGGTPYLRNEGRLVIGDRVRLRDEPSRIRLGTGADGAIILGNQVSLNTGVHMFSAARIEIGDGTRIGDNAALFDTSFHAVHQGQTVRPRPISIGRNVWIGRNAIILPGVTIGDHAVVAAGAVVFDDIPARELWRGNPAIFVKHVRADDGFLRG
ncbi:acyltransferase [Sphingobium sp.]|jgi:acetyltransferase-like isoleucine patch superfamily enzyme|uniref:acyltransferase n=1 Tax=Sphingobium sp. TaxID=1912891 RepID=UPI00257B4D7B|nr:acyltransferase [Sphingobium sp.]